MAINVSIKHMDVLHWRDIDIAYERSGSGPPLFLVHGAVSDSRFWRPQLEGLTSDFTVIAWDEPGAGDSSDLPDDFGLADYADCLAALIEETVKGPGHVAGLSWGGTVALELYRRRPSLVSSLILADSYVGWKGSLPADEVHTRVDGVKAALAGEAPPDTAFPGLFGPAPTEGVLRLTEEMAADLRPATVMKQVDVMAEADLSDILPQITVPTLLIWGEHDARSPVEIARKLETEIPDASLVVIPGVGHVSSLEAPELFNRAVREFVFGTSSA